MDIQGQKIIIRDWEIADLEEWKNWQNPGHEWLKTDGPYFAPLSSEEISNRAKKLQKSIQQNDWPTPRKKLVICKTESNKLIGAVSCYWESEATHWLSLGISIFDPIHWRKGLGFEALGLWTDYIFENLPDMVRLGFGTWSGNKGMIRLGEKLGFKQEACIRKARIVNGEYYDSIAYGILKEEWYTNYPDGFSHYLESNLK